LRNAKDKEIKMGLWENGKRIRFFDIDEIKDIQ